VKKGRKVKTMRRIFPIILIVGVIMLCVARLWADDTTTDVWTLATYGSADTVIYQSTQLSGGTDTPCHRHTIVNTDASNDALVQMNPLQTSTSATTQVYTRIPPGCSFTFEEPSPQWILKITGHSASSTATVIVKGGPCS